MGLSFTDPLVCESLRYGTMLSHPPP